MLQVFITVNDGKYEVTNEYIIKLQNVNDNIPEIVYPLQSEILNIVDGNGNKIKIQVRLFINILTLMIIILKIHVDLVILLLILRSIVYKIHTCLVNVKQLF